MGYTNLERGGKVQVQCPICKRLFMAFPSRIRAGRSRYCSRACLSAYKSQAYIGNKRRHLSGPDHPHWKGGPPRKICPVCGNVFYGWVTQTCSHTCGHVLSARYTNGSGNPNWKGQEVHLMRHYDSLIPPTKPKVCDICGGDNRIFVHHLDGNRTHNTTGNVTYVCQHCHTILHFLAKHPHANTVNMRLIQEFIARLNPQER